MIRKFAAGVEKILVVEELDPFFEEQIRLMSIGSGQRCFSGDW